MGRGDASKPHGRRWCSHQLWPGLVPGVVDALLGPPCRDRDGQPAGEQRHPGDAEVLADRHGQRRPEHAADIHHRVVDRIAEGAALFRRGAGAGADDRRLDQRAADRCQLPLQDQDALHNSNQIQHLWKELSRSQAQHQAAFLACLRSPAWLEWAVQLRPSADVQFQHRPVQLLPSSQSPDALLQGLSKITSGRSLSLSSSRNGENADKPELALLLHPLPSQPIPPQLRRNQELN